MFSITIASLTDVYMLNQSATDWQDEGAVSFPVRAATHFWKGRVALWVLCMRWWRHLCHLYNSQSLLAGSSRCTAQSSPVSPYCFSKPRKCSAQTGASQASSWSCLCLVFLPVFRFLLIKLLHITVLVLYNCSCPAVMSSRHPHKPQNIQVPTARCGGLACPT